MVLAIIAGLLLAAGCAPHAINIGTAPATAPEPSAYEGAPRGGGRVGVIVPEMLLYDVSAGGIFEYRDDWSESASKSVMVSAAVKLANYGYDVAVLPDAGRQRNFLQLKTKMRYHAAAFQSAFFANTGMSPKIDSLAYSLGSQDTLCDFYGVDAFLYIYGYEECFSKERRQVVGSGLPERTFMAAILVERSGRVSWYKHLMVSGNLDMRENKHAMRMMGAIFD